jgi:hypothetical protein
MLTNEQRCAVIDEIWAFGYPNGPSDGFRLLYAYERAVKEQE